MLPTVFPHRGHADRNSRPFIYGLSVGGKTGARDVIRGILAVSPITGLIFETLAHEI